VVLPGGLWDEHQGALLLPAVHATHMQGEGEGGALTMRRELSAKPLPPPPPPKTQLTPHGARPYLSSSAPIRRAPVPPTV
jgi:hypothetical protein